jgi:catechol 2,3-dioxygenase-like lactoylglutathione lyase family enzyme
MSASPSPVTGVDFVTLWTNDLTAADEFYGTLLGLPCIERYERVAGAEYETGNLTLQVLEARAIGREFRPGSPIALHVDDVAATRAALESRGVRFHTAFDSGVCHQAIFEDADGNPLILHHRYAPKVRAA